MKKAVLEVAPSAREDPVGLQVEKAQQVLLDGIRFPMLGELLLMLLLHRTYHVSVKKLLEHLIKMVVVNPIALLRHNEDPFCGVILSEAITLPGMPSTSFLEEQAPALVERL